MSLTPMPCSSLEQKLSENTLNLPTILCCLVHSNQAASYQLH